MTEKKRKGPGDEGQTTPTKGTRRKVMERHSIRLESAVAEKLNIIAAESNSTLANIIRQAINNYIEHYTFHTELNSLEEKLSKSINVSINQTIKVGNELQLLFSVVDQLIKFNFAVAPDVQDGDREASRIRAALRYEKFKIDIHNDFNSKTNKSILSENLNMDE